MLIGVGAGAFAGLVNGVLINYASIPPFITTLGMLYAARSLVVYLTGGQPIAPLPDAFSAIARADVIGLPLLLFYAAAIVIVAQIVLQTTVFGGNVRAIGGNREAASNAGINVRGISTTVYTLSGLSAAFAGVLMSARLGSGQPSIGVGFELQVISAVIIGGTSLFGGIGSVFGSLLGSLVLSVLTTGLILLHIDPVLQDFVIGVIIVVAVGIDQVRRPDVPDAAPLMLPMPGEGFAVTPGAWPREHEVAVKVDAVRALLQTRGDGAAALSARRNFAWLTAGGDNHVLESSETGVATVLVTPGEVLVITSRIERARMLDEELRGLHRRGRRGPLGTTRCHRRGDPAPDPRSGRRRRDDRGCPAAAAHGAQPGRTGPDRKPRRTRVARDDQDPRPGPGRRRGDGLGRSASTWRWPRSGSVPS